MLFTYFDISFKCPAICEFVDEVTYVVTTEIVALFLSQALRKKRKVMNGISVTEPVKLCACLTYRERWL